MDLRFEPGATKENVFKQVGAYLEDLTIKIASIDKERPWGGFLVIDGSSTEEFINTHFPDYDRSQIVQFGNMLSPKILLVAPGQKLSWQYHDRRAELWKGIEGPTGYMRSINDTQGKIQMLTNGGTVQFDPGERHRLVGLENWGIVAEIWQHTDSANPSDEDDIVRLADEYGRQS